MEKCKACKEVIELEELLNKYNKNYEKRIGSEIFRAIGIACSFTLKKQIKHVKELHPCGCEEGA